MIENYLLMILIYCMIVTAGFISLVVFITTYSLNKANKYKRAHVAIQRELKQVFTEINTISEELKHADNNMRIFRGQLKVLYENIEKINNIGGYLEHEKKRQYSNGFTRKTGNL